MKPILTLLRAGNRLPIRSTFLCLPIVSALLATTFWSCKQESRPTPRPAPTTVELRAINNQADYNRILSARVKAQGVPFTIESVRREDRYLYVQLKGGCSAEAFKVYWDGLVMDSYPAQINLLLTHEPTSSTCPTDQSHTIKVDLPGIIGQNQNVADYIVHVRNGSQIQDTTLDPNKPVSNQ